MSGYFVFLFLFLTQTFIYDLTNESVNQFYSFMHIINLDCWSLLIGLSSRIEYQTVVLNMKLILQIATDLYVKIITSNKTQTYTVTRCTLIHCGKG